MCGIFGIVYRSELRLPDEALLRSSVQALAHRGPDASGVHREPGLALAHTRLSLLDLSDRARQPFWDVSGRYALVYNGEIYNFRELRRELESRGAEFRSSSDTEVLLQSLILDGFDSTLRKIEGMFAFAFYDADARRLQLARDRLGIKPLFVYEDETQFLFASEICAFRGWTELRGNPFQISSCLLGHGGPTINECLFEGVRIVPPGEAIEIDRGKRSSSRRYFRITDVIDPEETARLNSLPDAQLIDHVDGLLHRSVAKMLVADTPVGALCSGGVDSSVLLAIAARTHKNLAIFHANVVGSESEHSAALALSKHLGLELRTIEVHDQDFIDLLPEVTTHYGHPFSYHPNSIPFLSVSKLVHQHGVKAVLSGEGADECFLGYPSIVQQPFVESYGRKLGQLRALVHRIPKFGKHLWPVAHDNYVAATILNGFERECEEDEIRSAWQARSARPDVWNVRTPIWLSYHLRSTLHRNDSLGMAASLEARFPYLDEDLVRAAVILPHRAKVRFSTFSWEKVHPFMRDKWVLRQVASRYLPRQLSQRKKLGFPVNAFQRLRLPDAYFRDSFIADYFRLNSSALRLLLTRADQSLKVQLLLLDIWGELLLRSASQEQMQAKLRAHLSIDPTSG